MGNLPLKHPGQGIGDEGGDEHDQRRDQAVKPEAFPHGSHVRFYVQRAEAIAAGQLYDRREANQVAVLEAVAVRERLWRKC